MPEVVEYDRRTFLACVSSLGVTALAGCSSDSGSSDGGGDGGNSEADSLTITDNEIGNSGSVTTSTLTVENTGEEESNPTVSVNVGIGPDGLYGEYSDERSVSIAGGETAEVTLDLFDGNELSEVAFDEVQNGFLTLTYFIDGVEKSHQELGEESSQYVSFNILYSGSWQGALGTESGQRSISGQGDSHLPVDNGASIVSGNAQKQDDGSGTLTVQILVDGEVISEQSTSAEYGVAQISESI
ncbi:hypothetical protein [Natronomonas sp.]|uniref:hypothetical protein n=1 Tax=Natronomonas sp. TaxID=2184060 RepID=UPI002616D80A|nr:hypothetical protein [Natronomonas sp.]